MTKELTWTVEVSDDEAEALAKFDDERLSNAMIEALEELASAQEKRDELRRRRPDQSCGDTEELSGEDLEAAMRDFLRGKRKDDPRL